jgi:GNAT superfamily N-acetyltransferase
VGLRISSLAQRPELAGALDEMPTIWHEFMKNDPIGNIYYAVAEQSFPEYILVADDSDDPGRLVAKAYAAPFRLVGDTLPDDGWDGVLRRALRTMIAGDTANAVSAIEIAIRPDRLGEGLSGVILKALREHVAGLGFAELLAPVRPNGAKDLAEPMSEYAWRTRDDGLPVDPWLRVHVRAGGRIDKVATRSMVIPGTLADWREWTGLPFDKTGPVTVPTALTTVLCDVEHDYAVYVEPNVWVRHRLC